MCIVVLDPFHIFTILVKISFCDMIPFIRLVSWVSVPNFSFLECLEVAEKFVVEWWGVGYKWVLCLTSTQVKLNWSQGWVLTKVWHFKPKSGWFKFLTFDSTFEHSNNTKLNF